MYIVRANEIFPDRPTLEVNTASISIRPVDADDMFVQIGETKTYESQVFYKGGTRFRAVAGDEVASTLFEIIRNQQKELFVANNDIDFYESNLRRYTMAGFWDRLRYFLFKQRPKEAQTK